MAEKSPYRFESGGKIEVGENFAVDSETIFLYPKFNTIFLNDGIVLYSL